ncbi:haloacid dehalogenase superfamily, subfamily IA, variant 3 with third motif having DD or ED/haloacid dehalogenase superfamily, subfamily IA, variant 1 with third motif having Dx(3-4)D or Dx(3-4)E [Flaviramulus basaltis]|uniref:Haloacid dehalogenase superfamily, subfamily IA, variant 3 with third motif having DD or ED/haloacid dehalogenase superfamily, subfamily IA, variant 1 with third motif having Dx(3-4)D or Dx(3-4)E n=1 Tax=Flaviramulus basaltis TaxID=369401 RepID=A0A1K2IG73_9FLAO|nr:HAD family phosphatase [Flaviramulus basaltis]SFZ91429.1 haloacid dehalogenase superfamily, subfamily IA, variant 3 with third motif having DD or ED/haloacid dehalogenase superfamily, subfamily IA, variant 1 with third motif having Dx(3-4)D or Dx(3-4)E [Flaviramulus basaltis]
MLKAVIFDMDGVIIDSEPMHNKAYHDMFDEVGINVSNELYESFTGQSTINICKRLCDYFNLEESPETLVALKRKHYKQFFESNSDLGLIDGVLDLIKDYHSNGLKLVLASSAAMTSINQIFDRFELNPYFIAKFSGGDLKQSKPHPEIFIKAAKATGFSNKACIVIEDSTNGIEAAKAANIFCVGYDSFHSKNQDYTKADMVIKDFKEIEFNKINNIIN